MWQRFTERARKVIFYAQEEAQKFGEGYVSTEHLLLGIVRESDSVASKVLEHMGVSLHRVRSEVEKQLPRGETRPSQDMTLTPLAKRVIDLAYDEARSLNNNYIGTEHLLLGLVREGDGLAGRVLEKLGIELDKARLEVAALQDTENPSVSTTQEVAPRPHAGTIASETLKALRALVRTDAEARGMLFIGTHDYLWAFLEREDCVAYRAIVKSGIKVADLKTEIGKMRNLEPRDGFTPKDDPIASAAHPEAERIAQAMGTEITTTGHLLLSMIVMSWSSVYLMMSNVGVAYEHIWLLVAQEGSED